MKKSKSKQIERHDPMDREIKWLLTITLVAFLVVALLPYFQAHFIDTLIQYANAAQFYIKPDESFYLTQSGTGVTCPQLSSPSSAVNSGTTTVAYSLSLQGSASGCSINTYLIDVSLLPEEITNYSPISWSIQDDKDVSDFSPGSSGLFGAACRTVSLDDEDVVGYNLVDPRLNFSEAYDRVRNNAYLTASPVRCNNVPTISKQPEAIRPFDQNYYFNRDNKTFFSFGQSDAVGFTRAVATYVKSVNLDTEDLRFSVAIPANHTSNYWQMQEHPMYSGTNPLITDGFFGIDGTTFTMDSGSTNSQRGEVVLFKAFNKTEFTGSLNDLKAYYTFDESSGNLINEAGSVGSPDSLGSVVDGTVEAGITRNVSGVIGDAYLFPASATGQIQLGASNSQFNFMHNTTSLWSMNFWMNSTSSTSVAIIQDDTGTTANVGIDSAYLGGSDAVNAGIFRGVLFTSVAGVFSGSGTVPDNQWKMITVTYDQSLAVDNMNIYVDGVLSATATKFPNTPSNANSAQVMEIGGYGNALPYAGKLDELSIWNKVLTPSEISILYNSGSGLSLSDFSTESSLPDLRVKGAIESLGSSDKVHLHVEVKDGNFQAGQTQGENSISTSERSFALGPPFFTDTGHDGVAYFETNQFMTYMDVNRDTLHSLGVYDLEDPTIGTANNFDISFRPNWSNSTSEIVTVFVAVQDNSTSGSMIANVTSIELENQLKYNFTDVTDFIFYEPDCSISRATDGPQFSWGSGNAFNCEVDYSNGLVQINNITASNVTANVLPTPPRVENLTASQSNSIYLDWDHDLVNVTGFRIYRTSTESGDLELFQNALTLPSSPQNFACSQLSKTDNDNWWGWCGNGDDSPTDAWANISGGTMVAQVNVRIGESGGGGTPTGTAYGCIINEANSIGDSSVCVAESEETVNIDELSVASVSNLSPTIFTFRDSNIINLTTVAGVGVKENMTDAGSPFSYLVIQSGDIEPTFGNEWFSANNHTETLTTSPGGKGAEMDIYAINQTKLHYNPYISNTGNLTTFFIDENTTGGNTYFYRVVALNGDVEEATGAIANFTEPDLNLVVNQRYDERATLTWDDAGADYYQIFRNGTKIVDLWDDGPTYVDGDIVNQGLTKVYQYKVRGYFTGTAIYTDNSTADYFGLIEKISNFDVTRLNSTVAQLTWDTAVTHDPDPLTSIIVQRRNADYISENYEPSSRFANEDFAGEIEGSIESIGDNFVTIWDGNANAAPFGRPTLFCPDFGLRGLASFLGTVSQSPNCIISEITDQNPINGSSFHFKMLQHRNDGGDFRRWRLDANMVKENITLAEIDKVSFQNKILDAGGDFYGGATGYGIGYTFLNGTKTGIQVETRDDASCLGVTNYYTRGKQLCNSDPVATVAYTLNRKIDDPYYGVGAYVITSNAKNTPFTITANATSLFQTYISSSPSELAQVDTWGLYVGGTSATISDGFAFPIANSFHGTDQMIDDVIFQYHNGTDVPVVSWTTLSTLSPSSTSYNDTSSDFHTDYIYRIFAKTNPSGPFTSFPLFFTPGAPSTPANFTATAINATVFIDWEDDVNATYFVVNRNGSQIGNPVVSEFTDYTPAFNTLYNYSAYAVGTSNSTEAFQLVTTNDVPTAPQNLTAAMGLFMPHLEDVFLNWENPADNGTGSPSTGVDPLYYNIERRAGIGPFGFLTNTTNATTTWIDDTVVSSANYTWKVRAVNALGFSPFSNTFSLITTPLTPPNPPTNLTATAVSGYQINVEWLAAIAGDPPTDYVLQQRHVGFTGFVTIATIPAPTLFYNVTGLIPGNTYDYRVRADNGAGSSGYSNIDQAITFNVPSAPQNLNAITFNNTRIDLTWNPPASVGNGILNYTIERETPIGGGFFFLTNTTLTSYSDTGLIQNTVYNYKVKAANSIGYGVFSNQDNDRTHGVPDAPINLSFTTNGISTINVDWDSPVYTGGVPITGYLIDQAQGIGGTFITATPNHPATPTNKTYTGLLQTTYYIYRISAKNIYGTGTFSANLTAGTFSGPSEPENFLAVFNSTRPYSVNLSWSVPLDDGGKPIQGYLIQRKDTNNVYQLIANVTNSTFSYVDTNLLNLATHVYRIAAFDEIGSFTADQPVTTVVPANFVNFTITAFHVAGDVLQQNYSFIINDCFPQCTFTIADIERNGIVESTLPYGQAITLDTPITFTSWFQLPTQATHFINTTAVVTNLGSTNDDETGVTVVAPQFIVPSTLFFNHTRTADFEFINFTLIRHPVPWNATCEQNNGGGFAVDQGPIFGQAGIQPILSLQNVGFFDDQLDAVPSLNSYVACFNPDPSHQILAFTSFGLGNGTFALTSFTGQLGDFLGVPVPFIFIIFLAAIWTGRSASTGIIFLSVAIGAMGVLGYFPGFNDQPLIGGAFWTLIVFLTVIGALIGKRFF